MDIFKYASAHKLVQLPNGQNSLPKKPFKRDGSHKLLTLRISSMKILTDRDKSLFFSFPTLVKVKSLIMPGNLPKSSKRKKTLMKFT